MNSNVPVNTKNKPHNNELFPMITVSVVVLAFSKDEVAFAICTKEVQFLRSFGGSVSVVRRECTCEIPWINCKDICNFEVSSYVFISFH